MMPIEPDHYGILELAPGSPMAEVKAQYRLLAKRYHPDVRGNSAASQEKFRRINAAYTFLSDAPRKTAYDDILKAARRMGAPPLKAVPPSPKAPSPTATGYHAPPTATGYHASPPDTVRMTRSAWLGATAGAIVVLVVIGLSLNSPGPGRPPGREISAPAPAGGASGSALEGGDLSEPGDGSASPAAPPFTPAPFRAPVADAVPRIPLIAPRPHAGDAQKQRLLPHSYAALPHAQLPHAQLPQDDHLLREKLAADMKALRAARARVRPALPQVAHETPAEQHREFSPTQRDLRSAEDARASVRNDLKALSVGAPPVKVPPVMEASPATVRAASIPAPFISAPTSPPPAPPEKAEAKQAAKVKAPAGQEFIMWGK